MGYAATSDAHHMVQPRPDGAEAARAVTLALADGGRRAADEIDWVSAHASSTPIGDIAEARALAMALGERAATVPVSATKALTGHPLGATGAIEAAMCALAIRDGCVPGIGEPRRPGAGAGGAAALPAPRRPSRAASSGSSRPRSGSAGSTPRSCSAPPAGVSAGAAGRVAAVQDLPAGFATLGAMTDHPAWERRFRSPILSFPVLGRRPIPIAWSWAPPSPARTSSTRGTGQPASAAR